MTIIQASLCLRFYTSSGWTANQSGSCCRKDQRLAGVMPRYFDGRDKIGQGSFELNDDPPLWVRLLRVRYDNHNPFSPDTGEEMRLPETTNQGNNDKRTTSAAVPVSGDSGVVTGHYGSDDSRIWKHEPESQLLVESCSPMGRAAHSRSNP